MDQLNVNKMNSPVPPQLLKVLSTSNMDQLRANELSQPPLLKVASTSNMDQLRVNELCPPQPPMGTIYRSRSVNLRKKKHAPVTEERFLEEPPYLCYTRKEFRPRCNTDPNKFKRPRAGALDSLVQQTIRMNAGPIAIAVRPPTFIGSAESHSNNSDDVSVGYFSIPSDEKFEFTTTIKIPNDNRRNSSSSSSSSVRSTNSVSFGIRSAPGSPMAPLQGQTDAHGQSVINLNTITKSPSHLNNNNTNNSNNNNNNTSANNTTKLDSKSQKQLSPSPVTSSSATIAYQSQQSQQQQQQNQEKQRSISPHPIKSQSTSSVVSVSSTSGTATGKNEIPEKEKKRKELSSSRQKKFHRHFQQVSKDERVLNYFSCALVSDILLQGHLYITENYFAFYSNVFGFVTKLLIPTSSVIKISKEKTAKIIPNAVGVATIDERHVFGSFMSREAAFRLMCSVCPPLEVIEIPKIPDAEICCAEESIEDDSSCSISGNESPPQLLDSTGASTGGCGGTTGSSDASQTLRHRPLPAVAVIGVTKTDELDGPVKIILSTTNCATSTPVKIIKQLPISSRITTNGISTTPPNTTSPSAISRIKSLITFKFPTDFHIVYLGILLTIILTLFSGFLMYRILEIEAKASYRTLDINKWTLNNDGSGGDEIYAEALKWQKELQTKSTEEAQLLLNSNLEQIARVRKSLETLSMLIHDTNPQFDTGGSDGGVVENFEAT